MRGTASFAVSSAESVPTLRAAVRDRLLHDVIGACASPSDGYMVLVLDYRATRILNSAVRMYDITQENIAVVESLHKGRQPFPELEAIYIIEPTQQSVARLVQDFPKPKDALYKSVHIFFTRHITDDTVLSQIKASKCLTSRIKTLKEMNVDFLAVESHTFHLDLNDAMVDLYSETGMKREACVHRIVDSLVTLCASLNEYPFIRYRSSSKLTAQVAARFQEVSNQHVNANTSFWWRGDGQANHGDVSLRGTLIMLDRAEDPAVPLLHSFTYQAMVNDLLDVDDDIIRYPVTEDAVNKYKRFLLSETDPLWVELRYLHMVDVLARLKAYTDELRETNLRSQMRDAKGEVTVEGMISTIQNLPEFTAMQEKQLNHLNVSSLCMGKLEALQLLKCAKLEQIMVTGVTPEAKELSRSALTAQLMELVKDPKIGVEETTRLLGLYIITQRGINEKERRQIMEAANPPLPYDAQEAIINLSFLGVSFETGATKQKVDKKTQKRILAEAKKLARDCDYSYSRYIPKIKKIVESFINEQMSTEEFPYIIEPPPLISTGSSMNASPLLKSKASTALSVRKHGMSSPASAKGKQAQSSIAARMTTGARVIVFIAGGATHIEMQALYDLMKDTNREVIIGTTHIINPAKYIFGLKHLDRESENKYPLEKQQLDQQKRDRHKEIDHAIAGTTPKADQDESEVEVILAAEEEAPKAIQSSTPKRKSIFCGCFGTGR